MPAGAPTPSAGANATLMAPAGTPGAPARDGPIKREVAHRVFAQEFNASRHQIAGTPFVSIRPESVMPADEATRNQWVLDTARRTVERIHASEIARTDPNATAETIMRKAIPRPAAEGAIIAREPYGLTDLKPFGEM